MVYYGNFGYIVQYNSVEGGFCRANLIFFSYFADCYFIQSLKMKELCE